MPLLLPWLLLLRQALVCMAAWWESSVTVENLIEQGVISRLNNGTFRSVCRAIVTQLWDYGPQSSIGCPFGIKAREGARAKEIEAIFKVGVQ